jgi:Sortase domain
MRLRWALLATVAGLAIAVGVPVGWSLLGHPTAMTQIGAGTVSRLARAAPSPAPVRSAPAGDRTTVAAPDQAPSTSSDPSVPVSGPGGNPLNVSPLPAPTRISIPTLDIDAAVIPEGVDANGEMAIPKDIRTIGWYQWGSTPGAGVGSTVLVGHVDSAQTGIGAFFGLRTIADGALISITTADGKAHDYRVIAREEFPKTTVPLAAIFDQTGPPHLVLATCGGDFDHATGSYRDNIVVTAQPA